MNSKTFQNSLSILKQLDKELEKRQSSIPSPTSQKSSSQISSSPTKIKRKKQYQQQQQSDAINIISEIDTFQTRQLNSHSQNSLSSSGKMSPLRKRLFSDDSFRQKCIYLQKQIQSDDKAFRQDLDYLNKDLEQTRQRIQSILKSQQIFK